LDRELRRKAAGLRTHALVGLGASLLTVVISGYVPHSEHIDALSRVIQGIIAGVGFLGGGAILKTSGTNEQESVHGITTAASIWVVAALGIACGSGQWIAALLAAALTLVVLVLGGYTDRAIKKRIASNGAR
jgi:putative Mg2+ transporter-C (MgtC) family protein